MRFIFRIDTAEFTRQITFFPLNNVLLYDKKKQGQKNQVPPVASNTGQTDIYKYKSLIHGIACYFIDTSRLQCICGPNSHNRIFSPDKLAYAHEDKKAGGN